MGGWGGELTLPLPGSCFTEHRPMAQLVRMREAKVREGGKVGSLVFWPDGRGMVTFLAQRELKAAEANAMASVSWQP